MHVILFCLNISSWRFENYPNRR